MALVPIYGGDMTSFRASPPIMFPLCRQRYVASPRQHPFSKQKPVKKTLVALPNKRRRNSYPLEKAPTRKTHEIHQGLPTIQEEDETCDCDSVRAEPAEPPNSTCPTTEDDCTRRAETIWDKMVHRISNVLSSGSMHYDLRRNSAPTLEVLKGHYKDTGEDLSWRSKSSLRTGAKHGQTRKMQAQKFLEAEVLVGPMDLRQKFYLRGCT